MPNYVQTETIDQIDDLGEVFELMRKFRISGKGCNSMEALKARLKDEWSKKTYAFQAEQISRNFSVLSGAVKEDVRKRKQLLDFYTEAHVFLDKMDGQMFTSLQKRMKYIKENMKKHIQQLKRTDYFLLVLGETSYGKSSLINLILGKEILPRTILSTPPTICELKFGKQPEMVVHFKDKDPETGETTKKIPVNKPNDPSSYLEQISTYVFNDGSMFKRVELFWPHDLLQNGIVIIESPGLGESKEMDDMVIQYLLEDFAFIYVTNSANAGGFREDIFKRFLQRAKDMHLGASKVGEDGNEVSLDVQEHLLSKCALFVCNKIDQVPEREMQFFKNHTTKKLQRIFPGVDPESQIVYMSSTRGTLEAQKCGTISKEFSFFVDRMRSVVSEHMDTKLEFQWEWLYMLLSKVVIQAEAFRVNASKQIEDSLEGDIKPHKLLFGNRGNLYEARQRYQAIVDEGSRHKNQLSLFGIKSISAIQIKREEFDWKEQLFSPLVEGAFGAIFLGTVRRHGETKAVALKVSNLEPDGQNASRLMDEIKIRRMLIHPHIVKFYGISLDTNTSRTALVMKKCKENLRGHILSGLESVPGKSENPAVVLEVCRLAKEITDGLAFIHAKGVVHRNLTLENILLSVENLVKISGFSLAILETEAIGTLVGTPIYMAPEVIQSHVYSTKADIYSLGLLMWEMWYGQWAFGDGISPAVVFSWVCSGSRPVDRQGCKPPPFLWKQLMTQCWEPNPDKRPTAQNCMDTLTSLQVELERKSKYSAVRKAMNWFVS